MGSGDKERADGQELAAGREIQEAGGPQRGVTTDGDSLVERVHIRLLTTLVSCPRVLRLYPPGHARAGAYIDDFIKLFDEARAAPQATLVLSVEEMQILVNNRRLFATPKAAEQFCVMLARRNITRIEIRSGIKRDETQLLVELLGTDYRLLLQAGGPAELLGRVGHPNLEVVLRREEEATGEWGGIESLLAENGLDDKLFDGKILGRLERIREEYLKALSACSDYSSQENATFHELLREFLTHPDWEGMSRDMAKRALEAFLEALEKQGSMLGIESLATAHARVESLKSFFRGLAPLVEPTEPAEDANESRNSLRFETARLREFLSEFQEEGDSPSETLIARMGDRTHFRSALKTICQLLIDSADSVEYARRRHLLLKAIGSGQYPTSAVARTLRFVTVDLPKNSHEPREHLINAVVDATRDEEALQHFLVSMTEFPHHVHPIIERLAARPEPFCLMTRLLRVPLLKPFRNALRRKMRELATTRQAAFFAWVRSHQEKFFDEQVFSALLKRGTELLGAICKEILTEGSHKDQRMLVRRLSQDGSDTALRLLVLGMPFDGSPCIPELIESLAEFRSPLATGALREIVHRANTTETHLDEAHTALAAILRNDSGEGEKFVREVADSRCYLLPRYRPALRRVATKILESNRWP